MVGALIWRTIHVPRGRFIESIHIGRLRMSCTIGMLARTQGRLPCDLLLLIGMLAVGSAILVVVLTASELLLLCRVHLRL